MTVKRTCDCCGKDDIGRSYTSNRLRTKIGNVECEVMVAIDNVWNSGDLCYECLVAHFHTAFSAGENSEAQVDGRTLFYPEHAS